MDETKRGEKITAIYEKVEMLKRKCNLLWRKPKSLYVREILARTQNALAKILALEQRSLKSTEK